MHEQPVLAQIADETASRRAVLKTVAGVGTAMLVGGCSSPDTNPEPAPTEVEPTNPTSETDPLQLLTRREKEVGHKFNELMVFLPMPTDEASAAERATETADKLKEFAKHGVKPYLVIEPNDPDGNLLDLKKLPTSAFGSFLDGLKKEGITDKQMGTVVVCPEANEPLWKDGDVDPDTYKKNVNALNNKIKKTFPDAKTGILLNSTSYDSGWQNRDKSPNALLKYVDGLHGIDEVCFQGFPWSNDTTDPTKFLNADVAIAVAARLGGPKKVALRFNTGSYATQINPDTHENATMDVTERGKVLVGVMKQAKQAKEAGYETTLQIFGENKATEEADWSYDQSPAATQLLKQCVAAADKLHIRTTIYG